MKKIALTSVITICVACPAFAEPTNTSSTFPSTGLMAADYTYTGQATYTNMGVYDGSVNANAEYDWDIITVNPGYYIPQSSTSAAQCTAGSFCPGIAADNQAQTPHYDSTAAQGITSCSTLESGAYPNSAAGASANTDCYRACTVANANIAHATAVSGNDYYGAGVDTCEPTTCESGWHVKAGVPNLTTAIGTQQGSGSGGWISNDGQDDTNSSTYGLTENGTFAVNYGTGKGLITGKTQCSTRDGNANTMANGTYNYSADNITDTLPDSSGTKCYCQLDSYTPDGGSAMSLSAPWVFVSNRTDANNCARYCTSACAGMLWGAETPYLAFRSVIFNTVTPSAAMCEANTITINWSGASQADIDANEAGSTVYGGDIRTPRAATPVTGKTFKGWKFQKPGQGGN